MNRLSLFAASAMSAALTATTAFAAVTGPAEVDGLPPYHDPAAETVTIDVNLYVPAFLQDGDNAKDLIPDMIAFGLESIDYANQVFHQNGAGVKFAVRKVEYVDWMGSATAWPAVTRAFRALVEQRQTADADVMIALADNDKTIYGQALAGTQESLGADVGITTVATFHRSSVGSDGDYAILAPITLAHELSHVLGNMHQGDVRGYWPNSMATSCVNGKSSLTGGGGYSYPILSGTVGCGNDPADGDELGTILETRHLLASTYNHEIGDDIDAGLSLSVTVDAATKNATVTLARTNNIESELAASVAIHSADWGPRQDGISCSTSSGMQQATLRTRACAVYSPLPAGVPRELAITLSPGESSRSVDVDMSAVPVDLIEDLKVVDVERDVGFVVTSAQGHAMPKPAVATLTWKMEVEQPEEPEQPQEPEQPGDSGGGGSMSWLALLALCLPLLARQASTRKRR